MKEDFLAVVETKRFLGREFLTWLVHRIEEGDNSVEHDGQVTHVQLGDRVVLEGGDNARLTVVGQGDTGSEMGAGLRRGKLLDRAKLSLIRGERSWELTLDGGMLTYDSLRCPPLGDQDTNSHDDPRAAFENDLYLRTADVDDAIDVLDRLFAEFCEVRGTKAWAASVLPALRDWADGLR